VIYLSGVTNDADEPKLIAEGIGLMLNPGNSYHLRVDRYPWWAADNGCFADKWVEDEHLSWLEALPRDRCLFAVSPDVYPDAAASLERGLQFAPLLREMGFPVAIVAQDDAEQLDWPWDELDALFIGGERRDNPADEWKLSAAAEALARRARNHGKWVHMGRVNGEDRTLRASEMGCLSVDGTALKYLRRRRKRDRSEMERMARGAPDLSAWQRRARAKLPLPLEPLEAPALPIHREAALR
jgi:hypothetical protein